MIRNIESLDKIREAAKQQIEACDCRILVCSGPGCIATGSEKIYAKFQEITRNVPGIVLDFSPCGGPDHGKTLGIKKTGCQGICELGPLVRIQKGGKVVQYTKVQLADCEEIFESTVQGDEIVERLLYQQNGSSFVRPKTFLLLPNRPESYWKTAESLMPNP